MRMHVVVYYYMCVSVYVSLLLYVSYLRISVVVYYDVCITID